MSLELVQNNFHPEAEPPIGEDKMVKMGSIRGWNVTLEFNKPIFDNLVLKADLSETQDYKSSINLPNKAHELRDRLSAVAVGGIVGLLLITASVFPLVEKSWEDFSVLVHESQAKVVERYSPVFVVDGYVRQNFVAQP